jgi:hypothetical protein
MPDLSAFSVAAPAVLHLAEWAAFGAAAVVLLPISMLVVLWLPCCGLESRRGPG